MEFHNDPANDKLANLQSEIDEVKDVPAPLQVEQPTRRSHTTDIVGGGIPSSVRHRITPPAGPTYHYTPHTRIPIQAPNKDGPFRVSGPSCCRGDIPLPKLPP